MDTVKKILKNELNEKNNNINKITKEEKSASTPKVKTDEDEIKLNDFIAPIFENDAFVLYHHPQNFYSQKVLLVLHEKSIDFISYEVDLTNGEQYSNWFLALNPKGEVPVLRDGLFKLSDSTDIINYLERKFLSPNHLPLSLPDVEQKLNLRLQYFDQLLRKLPVGALTLGALIHDDLKLLAKSPFIGDFRENCLKKNDKLFKILKRSVDYENSKRNKTSLLRKLDLQERRKRLVYSRSEFQKLLDAVQIVLTEVESELAKQTATGNEWLVSSNYTLVDVSLGLLLDRLYQLGFENYFWSYGKMTHIESYFLRFKKRQSYQKINPSNFEMLMDFWQNTPNNVKFGAGFIGMAMFAAFAPR